MPNAAKSLEVLAQWVAIVDPTSLRIEWCTTALAERHPQWRAGSPLASVTDGFRGLAGLIERARTAGLTEAVLAAPDGSPIGAQAGADDTGLIHLRLTDLRADQQAAARHLNDREQLLLVSRSLSVGEMATTLAHELNQPIGAIANLLRGLLARIDRDTLDPGAVRPAIQRGVEHAMYAGGIIARVRDYVAHRQPKAETIALRAMVDDALSLLDWETERDGVSVVVTVDPKAAEVQVRGDRVLQQQVVVNLVRNAIEAMRSLPQGDRRLEISIGLDEDSAVLGIADRGPGIDDDAAARMFTPFFTTKPGGMGVGLHVCRSIVELQQGRLWFTRGSGPGCTFWVTLPRALAPEELPA